MHIVELAIPVLFGILTDTSTLSTYFASQAYLPHWACEFLKHKDGEYIGQARDYMGEQLNNCFYSLYLLCLSHT